MVFSITPFFHSPNPEIIQIPFVFILGCQTVICQIAFFIVPFFQTFKSRRKRIHTDQARIFCIDDKQIRRLTLI